MLIKKPEQCILDLSGMSCIVQGFTLDLFEKIVWKCSKTERAILINHRN